MVAPATTFVKRRTENEGYARRNRGHRLFIDEDHQVHFDKIFLLVKYMQYLFEFLHSNFGVDSIDSTVDSG